MNTNETRPSGDRDGLPNNDLSVPSTYQRARPTCDEIAEAAALATRLVQLAETDPESALVLAVRAAVEVMDLRREWRRTQRETSQAIARGADWRRLANKHVEHAEMVRRRAQPGPLARGGAA